MCLDISIYGRICLPIRLLFSTYRLIYYCGDKDSVHIPMVLEWTSQQFSPEKRQWATLTQKEHLSKRIGLRGNLKLIISMLKIQMLSLLFFLLPSAKFLLSLWRNVLVMKLSLWNLKGFFCYLKFLWLNNSLNFLSSYLQRFFTRN